MAAFRCVRTTVVVLALFTQVAGTVDGQESGAPTDDRARDERVHMHMLLEKTIFQVDVMTVDVWLAGEGGRRIEALLSENGRSSWLEDTIARIARDSREARVEIEFVRDVSLGQFVAGIRDELEKVLEAELIPRTEYEKISSGLPNWFAFLEERGIREGDRIRYRIAGDTLRTRFVSVDGVEMLDQADVGAANRLAVMGSYFVRGSSFRRKLVRSLFTE